MPTGPKGEKRPRSQTSAAGMVGKTATKQIRDTNIPDPQNLHRSIFSMDNLYVLRAMNSESVDLIYLDPPFNSNEDYSAPIGSEAAGAAFKDTWTAREVDLLEHNRLRQDHIAADKRDKNKESLYALILAAGKAHSESMFSYLLMMATRLVEMKRILRPTGSIYLHCDPAASHYLKAVMDAIFGARHFRNEIVWRRSTAHNDPGRYGNNTDRLLYYVASDKATWNDVMLPKTEEQLKAAYPSKDERGRYRSDNLTGPSHGYSGGESAQAWNGYDVLSRGRVWSAPLTGKYAEWIERNTIPGYKSIKGVHARLDALDAAGMIYHPKKGRSGWPGLKRYADAESGTPAQALFTDISGRTNFNRSKEWTNYPTQKPLALLERIIKASSNKGDMVLDPFCGCATTCVAAEHMGRKWIGIDLSPLSAQLVVKRISRKRNLFTFKDIHHRETIPTRTDLVRKMAPQGTPEHNALRERLFEVQEHKCNLCQFVFPALRHLQSDHIYPKAKGGLDWEDNFQLLCQSCNSIKGTRTMEEAKAAVIAQGGMNPDGIKL